MTFRKAAQLGLGVAVSLLFIWLIARATDLDAVLAALRSADPIWIGAGIGLFAAGYACRIVRWRMMLAHYAPSLDLGKTAVPFLVSVAANNVLPFRAGDAMRALAFHNWLGVGRAKVLATMVVERLLDLFSLLVALGLALVLIGPALSARAAGLLGVGGWVLLAVAASVAIALLAPQLFRSLMGPFLSKAPETVQTSAASFFDGLEDQAGPRRMPILLGWSALAWLFEGAVFYAAARAIPGLADAMAGLLAFPVATLATLLPSTPGYAGTFHYFAMEAVRLFGTPAAEAAAFAVLVHAVLWLTATIAGSIAALIWVLSRDASSLTTDSRVRSQ